ncbi:hypothetical protein [Burkholderia pseudomallei]|uniref:hypothetical protein n=1 Tax=Burkholderia pseudomallei TaxID=28450 RepID=UPI00235EE6AE|nr:hypothetical protein [Burkholderia pseudomallei]
MGRRGGAATAGRRVRARPGAREGFWRNRFDRGTRHRDPWFGDSRVVMVRRDAAAEPEPRMRLPAPEAARPARKGPAYARRVPHAPHPHKAAAVPLAALPRRRRSNRPHHSDAMREALARARRLLVPFIGAETD